MYLQFTKLSLCLLLLSIVAINLNSQCLSEPRMLSVSYDFDRCLSNNLEATQDYTELQPTLEFDASCATIRSGNVYRERPTINRHSCTNGVNGSSAICFSARESCFFIADREEALRFSVTIEPTSSTTSLDQISFYQQAPVEFVWADGQALSLIHI